MQQEISASPPPSDDPDSRQPANSPRKLDSLAIEVIGREGSIALFSGERILATRSLAGQTTTTRAAASLIPTIEELARDFLPEGKLESLASLSVAVGPGSFTGLRIAVTTAKTLAYALEIPTLAVNSLAAIAASDSRNLSLFSSENVGKSQSPHRVLVGLSAYRGQVYRGRFSCDSPPEIDIVSADEWKQELQRAGGNAAQSRSRSPSDGAASEHKKNIENRFIFMGDRTVFHRTGVSVPPQRWYAGDVRAVGVGRVGASLLSRGETTSALDLLPDYFRPSAAEEQAAPCPPPKGSATGPEKSFDRLTLCSG